MMIRFQDRDADDLPRILLAAQSCMLRVRRQGSTWGVRLYVDRSQFDVADFEIGSDAEAERLESTLWEVLRGLGSNRYDEGPHGTTLRPGLHADMLACVWRTPDGPVSLDLVCAAAVWNQRRAQPKETTS